MPIIELEGVAKHFTVRRRRAARNADRGWPAIDAGNRRKATRTIVRAVDGLTFSIEPGEVVGYLGPNGAGKSTTVKMLTGILVPSAGRISVAGLNPSRDRVALARSVGVVFGQRTTLWWDLPLRDSFDLVRRLYRVDPVRYRRNLNRLVGLLELGDLLDTPVRQLSLGQRTRGDLAAALLHDPKIIYLDEPTIGLDVVSKAAVRDFLESINREQGTTVLLTTHDLGDVERLCRRVMVIDHGRLAFDGDLTGLRSLVPTQRTVVVDLVAPLPPLVVRGVAASRIEGPRQWFTVPADAGVAELVARIVADYEVQDLTIEEPAIEDVVRTLYRRGAPAALRNLRSGHPGDSAERPP